MPSEKDHPFNTLLAMSILTSATIRRLAERGVTQEQAEEWQVSLGAAVESRMPKLHAQVLRDTILLAKSGADEVHMSASAYAAYAACGISVADEFCKRQWFARDRVTPSPN